MIMVGRQLQRVSLSIEATELFQSRRRLPHREYQTTHRRSVHGTEGLLVREASIPALRCDYLCSYKHGG